MRSKYFKLFLAVGGVAVVAIAVAVFVSRQNARQNQEKQSEILAEFQAKSRVKPSAAIYDALMLVKEVNLQNREIIAAMPVAGGRWNEYRAQIDNSVQMEKSLELSDIKPGNTIRLKTREPILKIPSGVTETLILTSLELLENIDSAFWGK